MPGVLIVARYAVFTAFAVAALAAAGSWLVRTRRLSPFSLLGRWLRWATDPLMRPIEARVVRLGGNPVNAGWWLVIGIAVAGVILLSLLSWILASAQRTYWAFSGGARGIAVFGVSAVYSLLVVAIIVRVIGSWFGLFAYSRWVRPAYRLTDWLVNPIRRLLPPVGGGMFDLSPLVAWLVLWLVKQVVLTVLVP